MKIAIVGFGIEGKASYDYWNTPDNQLVIFDEKNQIDDLPENATTRLGAASFESLAEFDLVIRSAGLAPYKIPNEVRVWSATNEFFEHCPAPIIGVTGTKGKGTTASLIASILRRAGRTVHLVGNIGKPALDILDKVNHDDIVVYELSSFQLWDLRKSPQTAVVLMIEPDHLDVHQSLDEYISAKANIVKYQTKNNFCVHHPTNRFAVEIASLTEAKTISYGRAGDDGVYVKNQKFMVNGTPICDIDSLRLPGVHNIENACAAITACLSYVSDMSAVKHGLEDFNGLPHRLKFVREVGNIRYYDDSIATTPGSAIAALNSFTGNKILILGGSDKGSSYEEIIKICAAQKASVVAIGETGSGIEQLCNELDVNVVRETSDMNAVVSAANRLAGVVDSTVLLSPASASFDQYKNYSDRGEQFVSVVESL